MLGKQKCKILKEIRQKIADENDIPYVTRECTHKGDCKGTCPKCEAELRYLEQQLAKRQSLGKRVTVAALCTGLAFGSTGCTSPADAFREIFHTRGGGGDIAGMIEEFPSPTPEVEVLDGEVEWTEPLEGEPAVEPEPTPDIIPGEVPDETWELEGDVVFEPEPTPAESGGHD